jgi:hypothetical protein
MSFTLSVEDRSSQRIPTLLGPWPPEGQASQAEEQCQDHDQQNPVHLGLHHTLGHRHGQPRVGACEGSQCSALEAAWRSQSRHGRSLRPSVYALHAGMGIIHPQNVPPSARCRVPGQQVRRGARHAVYRHSTVDRTFVPRRWCVALRAAQPENRRLGRCRGAGRRGPGDVSPKCCRQRP